MAKLNRTHNCPDWDYLEIHPGSDEMEACSCAREEDSQERDELEENFHWQTGAMTP